jgi:hypothetical protein
MGKMLIPEIEDMQQCNSQSKHHDLLALSVVGNSLEISSFRC